MKCRINKYPAYVLEESFDYVLYNIIDKWKENIDIELNTNCIRRAILNQHLKYKDTYLKYFQFCTLEKRFYTYETLDIKVSAYCGLCRHEVDLVEHMWLYCEHTNDFWNKLET